MSLLRLLIVLWLSLSVPTAALASVVNAEHCQRGKAASSEMAEHAQHAMHAGMQMDGDHAQHMAHAAKSVKTSDGGCSCGCKCNNTHCATSCAGLMAFGGMRGVLVASPDSRQFVSGPVHPVAAHHLDLLRPPILI
jgi:uncharacterized protein involved in copper resistance